MKARVWLNNRGIDEIWLEAVPAGDVERWLAGLRNCGGLLSSDEGGLVWLPMHAIRRVDFRDDDDEADAKMAPRKATLSERQLPGFVSFDVEDGRRVHIPYERVWQYAEEHRIREDVEAGRE